MAVVRDKWEQAVIDRMRALPWVMFTICSRCHRFRWCAGRRRSRVLCVECFDETEAA